MAELPPYVEHVRSIKRAVEEQLGFAPQCDCGNAAVVAYQAHPVDACGGATAPADVVLVCGACLRNKLHGVQERLLLGHLGVKPSECEQCGLTIVTLSDIIVTLQPLWIWSD